MKQKQKLEHVIDILYDAEFYPIFGVELEFYIDPEYDVDHFILLMNHDFDYELKKERGRHQYEITIGPDNPFRMIDKIDDFNKWIDFMNSTIRPIIYKQPKPDQQDFGNSMQFNCNFLNKTLNNLLDDPSMLHAAARGLCDTMIETFLAIAPTQQHMDRYNKDFMAPTHVCYGSDNRTAAIRIPPSLPKRLEHRLCAPDVDPYLAMFIILKSVCNVICLGGKVRGDFEMIYGNAFDPQYNLKPLPNNLKDAYSLFNKSFFLD